jgi:hypothetical protein
MFLRGLGMKHDWTYGTKKPWSRLFVYAMDNLHVRLNFNLSKEKGIKHHSSKEHSEISKIAKFGCEML